MKQITVKEHSIIFSTDMIHAILDGSKTMTRRVIKGVNNSNDQYELEPEYAKLVSQFGSDTARFMGKNGTCFAKCPYGQVGDRLWVRETWAVHSAYDFIKPAELHKIAPKTDAWYKTSPPNPLLGKWRPSIFMPRWASRILLEITNIRVERLQDITSDDAILEGTKYISSPINGFHYAWDKLNAKRGYSWESNCWVWVIEFKRIKP